MNPRLERKLALWVLAGVLAVNAFALSAELSIGAVNGTDNISHWALIQGMVRAVETGGNPLDFWSPEGPSGAATMRTYQPLAHSLVVLAYFALGKTVPLITVFLWVRYLAVVLLPAAFFVAAGYLELPPMTAAASAVLAPLISTNAFYGLDYSSYASTGRGLFPQSVAAILMVLAIGAGYRAVRDGRACMIAAILTGLTCICQFIYGWMAAVTIVMVALLPGGKSGLAIRLRRLAAIGAVALVVCAFQIVPVLLDGPILNHSRWEGQWKWDSFGAAQVMQFLVTGALLDFGRPPVLTLLAAAGLARIAQRWYRTRNVPPDHVAIAAGAGLWLLVFFGRATWGPLLVILGAVRDLHLHRVIGGLQVFLVLLGALGLVEILKAVGRVHVGLALAAAIAMLAPMIYERAQYLARNEEGGAEIAGFYAEQEANVDRLIAQVRQRGGRVYAGLGDTWGAKFRVGGVPVFGLLNMSLVPQTSAPYNLLALTADLIPKFDETRPALYRLFGIRSVAAPADVANRLPKFLTPVDSIGRFQLLDAPGEGSFDVVDVPAWTPAGKESFYEINSRWLESDWPEKKAHLWLEFSGGAPPGLTKLSGGPAMPPAPVRRESAGRIAAEHQNGETYSASVEVNRPSFVLFKMTWHPKWSAYVNGRRVATAMISPGFTGVPVAVGQQALVMRYEPGKWKLWMAIAGLLLAGTLAVLERKGLLPGAH
jgi:hypothetical protein